MNATNAELVKQLKEAMFQRAPTLGGECYSENALAQARRELFQRAPTLGGECYFRVETSIQLGYTVFQRAPTLGGECYKSVFASIAIMCF